jgi:hypothetical protein
MNESAENEVKSLLDRWISDSSMLRIIGGLGDGRIGFESLCTASRIDSRLIAFKWPEGMVVISLEGFNDCKLLTPGTAPDDINREEASFQLVYLWPSGAKVTISEIRSA